jgi:RHS repeat-associated protein
VNGDGCDDLVLFHNDTQQYQAKIARGSPTGFDLAAPFVDWTQTALPASGFIHTYALGDLDGDGRDDAIFLDWEHSELFYALGQPEGTFGSLVHVSLPSAGPPGCSASGGTSCVSFDGLLVRDFNGDGSDDVVAIWSSRTRPNGQSSSGTVRIAAALSDGSVPMAALSHRAFPSGTTVWRDLAGGDFDGDRRADILAAYTGVRGLIPQGTAGAGNWVPFGRNFDWLPGPAGGGLRNVQSVLTSYPFPMIVGSPNDRAASFFELAADFNGDGIDDLVSAYRGIQGGMVFGRFLGPTGIVQPNPAGDLFGSALASSTSPQHDTHKLFGGWYLDPGDVNGDGIADLIYSHGGDSGAEIDFMIGTATGFRAPAAQRPGWMGPLDTGLACPGADSTCRSYFPMPRTGDFNGDGKTDVLMTSLKQLYGMYWVDGNGSPLYPETETPDPLDDYQPAHAWVSVPGATDRIGAVHNGLGGTISVTYEPMLVHVRDPYFAPDCLDSLGGSRSLLQCGVPNRSSRYVATRVVRDNGRGWIRSTAYRFRNPRVDIGPVADRRDLGFQVVTAIDEQTEAQTVTTYSQWDMFHGLPVKVERFACDPAIASPCTLKRTETVAYTYASVQVTPFTQFPAQKSESREIFEFGVLARTESESNTVIDADLNVVAARSCRGATCRIHTSTYHAIDPAFGMNHRHRVETEYADLSNGRVRVLAEQVTLFGPTHPADVVEVQRWLTENPDLAECNQAPDYDYSQPEESCGSTVTGAGRYVSTVKNRVFDPDLGVVVSEEDALGRATTFEPESEFLAWPSVTRNALLHTFVRSYDRMGRVTAEMNEDGGAAFWDLDVSGRLRSTAVSGFAGNRTEHDYLDLGDPTLQRVVTRTFDGYGDTLVTTSYVDGFGAVYRKESSEGVVVTLPAFAGRTQLVRVSQPFASGAPARFTEVRHDWAGRPERVQRVGPTYAFEKLLIDVDYFTDRVVTKDARGGAFTAYLDAQGRVWKVVDEGGFSTTYTFDPSDRVRRITLPVGQTGNIIDQTFDSWGRRKTWTDYWTGTTTWTYDDADNVTSRTNSLGRTVSYQYDDLDRLVLALGWNWSESYEYDDDQRLNNIGRLSRVVFSEGTIRYDYDPEGYMTAAEVTLNGVGAQTFTFAHDALGRERLRVLPNGQRIEWSYEGTRPSAIRYGPTAPAMRTVFDFAEYWPHGGLKRRFVWPPASATPVETVFNFDADLRPDTFTTTRSGVKLQDLRHTFDPIGNLLTITDNRPSTTFLGRNTSETQTFVYDSASRLKTATGVYGSAAYGYDALGNMTSKEGVAIRYVTNCGVGIKCIDGNLTAQWRAHFDLAGRRTRFDHNAVATRYDYLYDEVDRLMAINVNNVPTTDFAYLGKQRFRKTHTKSGKTTTTYYFPWGYEMRKAHESPGQWSTSFRIDDGFGSHVTITGGVQLPQQPGATDVARVTSGYNGDTLRGPTYGTWIHLGNHLGSNSVGLKDDGTTVTRQLYRPFGDLWRNNSAGFDLDTPKYTGQELDEETGIYSYDARYYDPLTGRFLTADDHLVVSSVVVGYNRYAYVLDNPLRYTDPTGNEPVAVAETLLTAAILTLDVKAITESETLGAAVANTGIFAIDAIIGIWPYIPPPIGAYRLATGAIKLGAGEVKTERLILEGVRQADPALNDPNFFAVSQREPSPTWRSTQTGDTSANSKILRGNLGLETGDGLDAHHLVPSTHSKAAPARKLLEEHQIDINDAVNGVGLKATGDRPAHHGQQLHSHAAIKAINERLARSVKGVQSWAKRREALVDELDQLKSDILEGAFP